MLNKALIRQIKEAAYLEGNFITRAGKATTYYIDKYLFETRPDILDPLTDELVKLLPDPATYDRLAAPELGAVPLASLVAVKAKKPFVIVKKENKDYGTKKLIEGKFVPGERVVVLEDVLTTGGAVLRACDILVAAGVAIVGIVGVINREEGAIENIAAKGFTAQALITTTDFQNC